MARCELSGANVAKVRNEPSEDFFSGKTEKRHAPPKRKAYTLGMLWIKRKGYSLFAFFLFTTAVGFFKKASKLFLKTLAASLVSKNSNIRDDEYSVKYHA